MLPRKTRTAAKRALRSHATLDLLRFEEEPIVWGTIHTPRVTLTHPQTFLISSAEKLVDEADTINWTPTLTLGIADCTITFEGVPCSPR
jgi:hypothetical protein